MGKRRNFPPSASKFIIPGETACFACAPPLVVAEEGNENKIKREGVCAASLPTTMGIVAGLLVQNVLKFVLNFGELTYLQSYNSLKNYFSDSILLPNDDCIDVNCIKNQNNYKEEKIKKRKQTKKEEKEIIEEKEDLNEWGIEINKENEEKGIKKEDVYVSVNKETSLDDLQKQLGSLFKK
jgi:ubiquitin-like modifier-activating enzyme 5